MGVSPRLRFPSQRSSQTLDPSTKLRQMVAPVTDTLRTSDPRGWGRFLHIVRCHSQRRHDFASCQVEFLAKKMARRRSVRLHNFPIDPQDFLSSPLFRRPRSRIQRSHLLRCRTFPAGQVRQQILGRPIRGHTDRKHLLIAERIKSRKQFFKDATFLSGPTSMSGTSLPPDVQ